MISQSATSYPERLKPAVFVSLSGTAEEAAEKLNKAAKNSPQALKRNTFSTTHGTTEVVPFPTICVNQSSSATCEAVPFPVSKMIHESSSMRNDHARCQYRQY